MLGPHTSEAVINSAIGKRFRFNTVVTSLQQILPRLIIQEIRRRQQPPVTGNSHIFPAHAGLYLSAGSW
jgi:hypothetical protein